MSLAELGYEVVRGVLSAARCQELCARLSELIAHLGGEHASGARRAAFWEQLPRSRHGLEVFWQDDGRRGLDERLVMRVGHALHARDDRFGEAVLRSGLSTELRRVVGEETAVLQSAVIYKQPESDAVQFGMHQDAAYLSVTHQPLVLAFVALERCDAENGALQVAPRSHLGGRGPALRLTANGFVPIGREGRTPALPSRVLLEMEAGDVAFVHGLTWHASDPNRSPRTRRALVVHAMPARGAVEDTGWVTEPPGGYARIA